MSFAEIVDTERTAKVPYHRVVEILGEGACHGYQDFAVTSTRESGALLFWVEARPRTVFVRVMLFPITKEQAENLTGKRFDETGRVLGDKE